MKIKFKLMCVCVFYSWLDSYSYKYRPTVKDDIKIYFYLQIILLPTVFTVSFTEEGKQRIVIFKRLTT